VFAFQFKSFKYESSLTVDGVAGYIKDVAKRKGDYIKDVAKRNLYVTGAVLLVLYSIGVVFAWWVTNHLDDNYPTVFFWLKLSESVFLTIFVLFFGIMFLGPRP